MNKTQKTLLSALRHARPGRAYMVIGIHVWGKAATALKAAQRAAREGLSGLDQFIVYDVQQDATLDGFGAICYRDLGPSAEEPYREVARYQKKGGRR